jgi:two-component system, NarL family, sensor histidine kinase UhpB
MRKVDPLAPGARLDVGAATAEVAQLATAFNDMLDRLEDERRESARRALRAQEAERQRLARELHDELGQSLTGVLLLLDEAIRRPQTGGLERAREDARHSLEDIRRIARDLRPDTLVEIGLLSGLDALATRFTRQTGVHVERRLDPIPAPLGEDAEVVIYRVAQEALTNVARHADAHRVSLELSHAGDTVTLSIDDDGIGIPSHVGHEARGITGMRERALLVRGRLTVRRARDGGTRVTLDIPVR